MAYIYKITNDINGKMYIGKTSYNIEKRWNEHCKASRRPDRQRYPLYSAIKKYGIDHFSIEVIETCADSEASDRETYWISELNTYRSGYNATLGGDGTRSIDHDMVLKEFKRFKSAVKVAEKMNINPHTVSEILISNGVDTGYRRGVEMVTKDGDIVAQFESMTDAANYVVWLSDKYKMDTVRKQISKVNDRSDRTAYGYIWRSFHLNKGGEDDGSSTAAG